MVQGGVVVFGGRQPACILRLAPRHFSSPPFYLFSSVSTIYQRRNKKIWRPPPQKFKEIFFGKVYKRPKK